MLVMLVDLRFDNTKVKTVLTAKETRFVSEAEIAEITDGVQIGSVPPSGNLFKIETIT